MGAVHEKVTGFRPADSRLGSVSQVAHADPENEPQMFKILMYPRLGFST